MDIVWGVFVVVLFFGGAYAASTLRDKVRDKADEARRQRHQG